MGNSGERMPCRFYRGVSEQDTKEVLDGIGLLAGFAARSSNIYIAFCDACAMLVSLVDI